MDDRIFIESQNLLSPEGAVGIQNQKKVNHISIYNIFSTSKKKTGCKKVWECHCRDGSTPGCFGEVKPRSYHGSRACYHESLSSAPWPRQVLSYVFWSRKCDISCIVCTLAIEMYGVKFPLNIHKWDSVQSDIVNTFPFQSKIRPSNLSPFSKNVY